MLKNFNSIFGFVILLSAIASAQIPDTYTNLKILPKDISKQQLLETMKGFTGALGVRCNFCHDGEEGQPLSTFDFANNINPDKSLFINAAVHITEREKKDSKLRSYLTKMVYLQMKGFNTIASYVAHPVLFYRIKSDIAFLKSNGVQKIRIQIFRGVFNGKYYPYSFNSKEKEFLESMEADYPEFEILNKSHAYYGNYVLQVKDFLEWIEMVI